MFSSGFSDIYYFSNDSFSLLYNANVYVQIKLINILIHIIINM